jgi:hypothetical protein
MMDLIGNEEPEGGDASQRAGSSIVGRRHHRARPLAAAPADDAHGVGGQLQQAQELVPPLGAQHDRRDQHEGVRQRACDR